MASITLTIPDALTARVVAGFCGLNGYTETINGSPNPETKVEFMRKVLLKKIKKDVLEYEGNKAQKDAVLTGDNDIQL